MGGSIDARYTDVLVIGSGGAGMRAAIAAADRGVSVLLLSKGRTGVSGSTVTAVADACVDSRSAYERLGLKGDPADSPEIFKEDIIRGGGGLSDPRLVDRFVHDIPDRMEEMLAWGARVRNLTHNAGHRYPRSVIINGRDYADTLLRQIRKRNHITIMEHVVAHDLRET